MWSSSAFYKERTIKKGSADDVQCELNATHNEPKFRVLHVCVLLIFSLQLCVFLNYVRCVVLIADHPNGDLRCSD